MDQYNLEKVPRGMMDELNHAGDEIQPHELNTILMNTNFSLHTPLIQDWYLHSNEENSSKQLKLIKHIWLDEPQFKAEKPKKWVVQSKEYDEKNRRWYMSDVNDNGKLEFLLLVCCPIERAFKFDTKEEAEQWVDPQTEAVEVEE